MKCVKTVVKDSCSAHFSATVEGNNVDIGLTAKIDSESTVSLEQEHHQVLRPYQEEQYLQEPFLQEQSPQEPFLHLHFHILFQVNLQKWYSKISWIFFLKLIILSHCLLMEILFLGMELEESFPFLDPGLGIFMMTLGFRLFPILLLSQAVLGEEPCPLLPLSHCPTLALALVTASP